MSLPLRARAAIGLMTALTRLHLLPDGDKLLATPAAKRMALGPAKGLLGPVPDVATEDRTVTTRDGAAVRVRVYRTATGTDQPLLYAHGGGFVVGGLESCDHICKQLAAETGAVVVSVEYRLAPEHRYPGPLHDVVDAAHWLRSQSVELGVDPDQLVVAGDSAGGNLAAVLALVLRDAGLPPAGQLLIYPAIDLSMSLPGIHAYRGVGLTVEQCRQAADAYLGGQDPTDPCVSPWYADVAGVAPALVVTVEHDLLRSEGAAYAEKLCAAGVPVTHLDVLDQAHGSLSTPRLYDGVGDVYAAMGSFVKRVALSCS